MGLRMLEVFSGRRKTDQNGMKSHPIIIFGFVSK